LYWYCIQFEKYLIKILLICSLNTYCLLCNLFHVGENCHLKAEKSLENEFKPSTLSESNKSPILIIENDSSFKGKY